MSININSFTYSSLKNYAVLASTGIISLNTTTITNGNYCSTTASYSNLVGIIDSGNAGIAQAELVTLINNIFTYRAPLPATILGNQTTAITLYPNKNDNPLKGKNIIYSNIL